jgi:hypothetical protein
MQPRGLREDIPAVLTVIRVRGAVILVLLVDILDRLAHQAE